MGQIIWIVSGLAAVVVAFGFGTMAEPSREPSTEALTTAVASSEIAKPEAFFIASSGSALASAAFGLSALQPETYNGEIVLDIIDASPLEYAEKERLAASLDAAESGDADLRIVLTAIRVSLAVD